MDFLEKPPQWLVDAMPEGARGIVQGWGWYVLLGFGALVVVLLLWAILGRLFGALFGRKETPSPEVDRREMLAEYPPLRPSTGDRRLLAEGVPVRLRLVVLAPAGTGAHIDPEAVADILDKAVPGLGAIYQGDKPRVKLWPLQTSYKGFANYFHSQVVVPEPDGEPTPWVMVAGRLKIPGNQVMLGVALQALKATTVGRRTVDSHEWASVLRVRVRD